MEIMKAQKFGKILVSGGGGATKPMPNFTAYAASKAGVVRFAETLAGEVAEDGIAINVIAPGALDTLMLDEVLKAGPHLVGEAFYEQCVEVKQRGGDSAELAARLCVFLASSRSDGISGKLISAKWDPWADLPQYTEFLESDIYTLRRIVPSDRGMAWGEV